MVFYGRFESHSILQRFQKSMVLYRSFETYDIS